MIRIALDRSWPDVIRALRGDPAFWRSFAERLCAVSYEAWFWECIRVSDGPFECSTAGMGVPWLHARIDTRPKYFRHAPYRAP